ncbi:MAG: gamma-glutamyl-gamma-aminobutyrate hydrolase family protein [Actinobacteria bacterium]|nr:gamma-glutamyl-gamma-aminobutyrate hydrolase family protein [Actinomycetota bacterium]
MPVTLVVTEHSGSLSPELLEHYEAVRGRLERAARSPVTSVQYEQVVDLHGADAVVLSGSFAPWAVHASDALDRLGEAVGDYGGPVLGICAGMQLQARFAGGTIRHSPGGLKTGFSAVDVVERDGLLRGLPERFDVYKHHGDEIEELPESFRLLARSTTCAVEAIFDPSRRWWGTQFHPEQFDAAHPTGERILRTFFELARAS